MRCIPTVSVVITCYNYGHYLAGCLESVLAQTYADYEIVVVDDGSTDNTSVIIQPYCENYGVRYVRQKNGGQANAKNRGITESKGELIAFLDADDLWEPEKLEKQIVLFENQDVGIVYSGVSLIGTGGQTRPSTNPEQYLQPRRGKVTGYFIYDNFVPFSSVLIREDCFDALGMFDESLAMGIDWDLWLRFSTKYQFDYCEESLLLYRVGHSGQMSKNLLERIRCADKIVAKFNKNSPDAVSEEVTKDAAYYSCCLRGYALRQYGFRYPLQYYWKAILLFPFRKKAYLGLLKAPVRALFGR